MAASSSTVVTALPMLPVKRSPMSFGMLSCLYFAAVLLPWALSYVEGLAVRGVYEELVQLLSIVGLSMMLFQFFLTARVDAVARHAGVDNTMRLHTRMGEFLGYLILLHPFLIVAPRFFVAPSFALSDTWDLFTRPETSTGMYAWCLMLVWVLMAVFKERTGLSYESWRYTHSAGFVAIIILATHHAVTVGRHGRYNAWFDTLWIALCVLAVGMVLYVYFVRPRKVARQPFRVVDCAKGSESDWYLTIEKEGNFPFDFDAGQFTWISTSPSVFARNEHPFSIATTRKSLPKVSYVIRELGDYTRQLGKLVPGQRVWVDGPHGVFTQNARNARGVVLIAGGAGIGPIMGILRELCDQKDERPIRLIYGNRTIEQMSFLTEIESIQSQLDMESILVLEKPPEEFSGHTGYINRDVLEKIASHPDAGTWDFYICGPPIMVKAVESALLSLSVPRDRILYEQLGF
ncbi:ferredoxin reductase family protein [Haliea sp. E1-2-M8]|uniref:ferredoxin reductase family protein n=1 Tax=Haliea sp. E1-2-M8 TaxID=3064706 RepID=UPI002718F798|nr:ferredoxin reductase family protein [Haliea sp. E1-2-M8]MDO8863943.1 ferredoxin reductase family protein [Haliea sp. E1-2-M8]